MKNKFNWQRKYITNTIFSDSIPRLKVRENLNSQWDCTHFHKTQLEEKKKFLKVFSDSLVRSSLFPADVLLMTHGGQLIPPSTLNFLLKVFLFLPSADFPLLSLLTFCDFFFLDILWFFFPPAADLILTRDQFPLLLVTANMSVILLVKSLATPIGTRCNYSSLGVTRPSWIPNSRAVKTYRLVYNEWDILAWTAFPNKGKLAPAVWFPELKLRNTERIGQFTVRVVQNMLKKEPSK